MPYSIREDDGKFCVHKDDDGMNMGCHDTRQEAEDHMAALYAAEKSSMIPEQKSFAIKAEDIDLKDNHFRGIASFMGNVDEGGDVILPGAFATAIPDFLKSGFVPIGHDWFDKPVAMPVAAEEVGNKFMVEAEFHSTAGAQEAKTIMQERLAKGLDVGLSIGFDIAPSGAKELDGGEAFLKFADEGKHDLKLLDVDGIKKYKGPIRAITKIRRLFEFSIVSVPMNPRAVATAAKVYATFDFDTLTSEREVEAFLREVGLSKTAALKFVSTFKGLVLSRRDAEKDDAQSETEQKTESAESVEVPNPPGPLIVDTQTPAVEPFYFTADGKDYSRWIRLSN